MKTSDLKLYTGIYIDLQENLSSDDKLTLLEYVTFASETEVINLLVTGEMKQEDDIDIDYVYEAFSYSPVPYVLTEGPAGDVLKTAKDYWGKKATASGKAAMDKITGVSKQPMGHGPVYRVPKSGMQKAKEAGEKAKEAGKEAYGWLVKKAAAVKANPEAMQGLKIGAAAAVAALAIFIGRKIYKQHLSTTARTCAKADDKQSCIRKIKVEALNKQMKAIQSNMGLCDKSKNPQKCKAKIQQQLNKKKAEIQKILTKKKVKV